MGEGLSSINSLSPLHLSQLPQVQVYQKGKDATETFLDNQKLLKKFLAPIFFGSGLQTAPPREKLWLRMEDFSSFSLRKTCTRDMLMMKMGEICLNFHTFAIDNIRLSKTYPKSLNISRIDFQYITLQECEAALASQFVSHGHGHGHVLRHSHWS